MPKNRIQALFHDGYSLTENQVAKEIATTKRELDRTETVIAMSIAGMVFTAMGVYVLGIFSIYMSPLIPIAFVVMCAWSVFVSIKQAFILFNQLGPTTLLHQDSASWYEFKALEETNPAVKAYSDEIRKTRRLFVGDLMIAQRIQTKKPASLQETAGYDGKSGLSIKA